MRLASRLKLATLVYSAERAPTDGYIHIPSINSGDCWVWAMVAKRILRKTAKICTCIDDGKGHCFIKIGNLYYDAECLTGVEKWEDLNFFGRFKGNYILIEDVKEKDIITEWSGEGKDPASAKKACTKASWVRYLFSEKFIDNWYCRLIPPHVSKSPSEVTETFTGAAA